MGVNLLFFKLDCLIMANNFSVALKRSSLPKNEVLPNYLVRLVLGINLRINLLNLLSKLDHFRVLGKSFVNNKTF